MNVLVVEDDAGIAMLVNKMVRDVGHVVDVVSDYQGAIEAMSSKDYDIASVDLTLGEDTDGGVKTAVALRAKGVKVIVIITGHTPSSAAEILAKAPDVADAILYKPFTVPELMRALGLRHEEREILPTREA